VHIHAPLLIAPMAAALLRVALEKSLPADAAPGFWRVDVLGDPRQPEVRLARVGPPGARVMSAVVQRDSESSMRVLEARGSDEGGDLKAALAEVVAASLSKVEQGGSALLTVVIA